ncbi:hypothetical protein F4805DRAFT_455715 [Annulohypoxylon moriforme]|nr:hypothetical protein F4805DRAFT_455715 [Annulohypoxylon moriforme]
MRETQWEHKLLAGGYLNTRYQAWDHGNHGTRRLLPGSYRARNATMKDCLVVCVTLLSAEATLVQAYDLSESIDVSLPRGSLNEKAHGLSGQWSMAAVAAAGDCAVPSLGHHGNLRRLLPSSFSSKLQLTMTSFRDGRQEHEYNILSSNVPVNPLSIPKVRRNNPAVLQKLSSPRFHFVLGPPEPDVFISGLGFVTWQTMPRLGRSGPSESAVWLSSFRFETQTEDGRHLGRMMSVAGNQATADQRQIAVEEDDTLPPRSHCRISAVSNNGGQTCIIAAVLGRSG